MFQTELYRISKMQFPDSEKIYLKKKCVVCCDTDGTEFTVEINRRYYFWNLLLFFMTSVKFMLKYRLLKCDYLKFLKGLKHATFWKSQFNKMGNLPALPVD